MITSEGIPQNSLDLLRLIIINQMGLEPDRVNIYDEKWKIPAYEDLFITLEYRNARCLANRNVYVSTGGDPVEEQNVNMIENITVGVFSRDRSATQRKEEVLMAILSNFSQSFQEAYAFKIVRAGSIEDVSAVEGAAMLKRYDINLVVFAWYQKIITTNYISPPFLVRVVANDRGAGKMVNQFAQLLTQPK